MTQDLADQAIALMQSQRFGEARNLLQRSITQDPEQWNAWYLVGQCCRFLNDTDGAIRSLSRAAELKSDEPAVFLALGIAYQLKAQWDNAVGAFRSAIEIDPDFELAYNSLALTQKKAGDLDKALHNYDAGVKALTRRIARSMRNVRNNPIFKHRETRGQLWVEYAGYAALWITSNDGGIDKIAFPTGAQASEEERTEKHAGMYWTDMKTDKSETVRLFLPNFFNTFRESLKREPAYSNLIGNRASVLELLERHDEAQHHMDEATEFMPNTG